MVLEVCVDMDLTTRAWGHEISWTFGSCDSTQAYANNGQYSESCCLVPGEYTLSCLDTYGDGWHGGFLEIQGTRYCEDFTSGSVAAHQVTVTGIDVHQNLVS